MKSRTEATDEIDWRMVLDNNSIARYRPLLGWMQLTLFGIGSLFWVEATLGGQGFKAQLFGEFAFAFPAEFWAGLMMGASVITYIGLIKPVRYHMVIIGSLINLAQFLALSYSAFYTRGEFVVGLYASCLFAPIHLWMAFKAYETHRSA